MKAKFLWLGVVLLLTLSACGYSPGYGVLSGRYGTVSVPYVVGDVDGDLTASIVHEITASLGLDHRSTDGELLLVVTLVDLDDTNIGFRYEQIHGKRYKRSIIPTETRLTAIAEVSLVDAATGCSVLPTIRISASLDFDHEYNATRNDSNAFSLGQLSDADAAFEAARFPLNRRLAQKIVEYVSCAN
jgi:hypothetical protein